MEKGSKNKTSCLFDTDSVYGPLLWYGGWSRVTACCQSCGGPFSAPSGAHLNGTWFLQMFGSRFAHPKCCSVPSIHSDRAITVVVVVGPWVFETLANPMKYLQKMHPCTLLTLQVTVNKIQLQCTPLAEQREGPDLMNKLPYVFSCGTHFLHCK